GSVRGWSPPSGLRRSTGSRTTPGARSRSWSSGRRRQRRRSGRRTTVEPGHPMPEFRHPEEIAVEDGGEGWTLSTLADGAHVDGLRMVARRWRLAGGARSPGCQIDREAERFLYVIGGEGAVVIGGERLPL